MDSFTFKGSGGTPSSGKEEDKLEYMVHTWNGKATDSLVKVNPT
jgi:hypothetical protein